MTSICVEDPTVRLMLWLTDCPTSNMMPCCLKVLNPDASTVRV